MKTLKLLTVLIVISFLLLSFKEIEINFIGEGKINIKGRVKVCTETVYDAVDKFGEIQKTNLNSKIIYSFNSKGSVIEKLWYNPNGTVKSKESFKYNDNGKMIEDSSSDSKIIYKYDNKGNNIEENNYNWDGSLFRKVINIYDDKGNNIESNQYFPDGSLDSKYFFKYDNYKNEIEFNWYKGDGSLISSRTYKYEFDKIGNWFKKTEFKNNSPDEITEREITYY